MSYVNEPQLDALVNLLTEFLSSHQFFSANPELVTSETQRNPYSFTSRLTFSDGEQTRCFYAKIPIIDENNKNVVHSRLQAEFEHLRLLKNEFENDSNLSVATPIAYFEQLPALVTEEVQGHTLHDILVGQTRLFGGNRTNYDIANLCRLTGKWLSKFQSATALPRSLVNIEELQDYSRIRLDSILQSPDCPIDSHFKSRFLSHLADLGHLVLPADNPISLRHNDYAPHNIIADENSITLLDFTMCDESESFYDIAAFWERLESFKSDPMHSSQLFGELQCAFLDGLDRSVDLNSPALRLGRCKFHITQLASSFDRRTANPYRRWRDHRNLRRTLGWLNAEISRND